MNCEIHGGGVGNLTVVCCIKNCDWYERGLLHPFLDYDEPPAYLQRASPTRWTKRASSTSRRQPGLGADINFDYINANLVR